MLLWSCNFSNLPDTSIFKARQEVNVSRRKQRHSWRRKTSKPSKPRPLLHHINIKKHGVKQFIFSFLAVTVHVLWASLNLSVQLNATSLGRTHVGVIPSSPSQARWWDGNKRVSLRPLVNDLKPWSVSPDYNHWHSTALQDREGHRACWGWKIVTQCQVSQSQGGDRPLTELIGVHFRQVFHLKSKTWACSASWSPRDEETAPTPPLSHRGEEQDKMQNMCIDQGLEEDTVQLGWITAWTLVKKKNNLLDEEHKWGEEIQQWQQEGCLLAIN